MTFLTKTIQSLTAITRWIAMTAIFFMMALITVAVIGRSFSHPILGDVELVQLSMIVVIMFGLAYTQSENGHVNIGLLVDRFPIRVQLVFDLLSLILTLAVSFLISWVFYNGAVKEMTGDVIKTELLSIPQYPFKFIIAIGLFLWGLESLFKIILTIVKLAKGDVDESQPAKGGEQLWG